MEIVKLKVKSVTNFIKVVLFLFLCNHSFSQKISGTYCRNYKLDDVSTCIDFIEGGKFKYQHTGDLGVIEYGEGNYCLKKKKIILNFKSSKPIHKSTYDILKSKKSDKDSIKLNITVKDFDDKSIILFKKIKLNNDKPIDVENQNIYVKKSNKKLNIKVISVGYEIISFNLKPNKNYSIEVFLKGANGNPIKNQKRTFKIINYKQDSLVLYRNDRKELWVKSLNSISN